MNQREELKQMLAAVDALAVAMKAKLREKARQGRHGGLHPNNRHMVAEMLQAHVEELTGQCPHCHANDGDHDDSESRQAIDVCNLAMMLWVIGGMQQ